MFFKPESPRFELIKDYIKDKRVLDLGIVEHDISSYDSPYWLHRLVVQEAKYCVGVDIDRKGIEFLKNKGYNVVCANAEHFNLDVKFDVIIAGELIEHLQNFEGFVNCVKKHLNEGGLFILSTPNVFFFRNTLPLLLLGHAIVNPEHTCWFDEVTMRQLLKRFQFEVFDVKYISRGIRYNILPLPKKIKHTTMLFFCRLSKNE